MSKIMFATFDESGNAESAIEELKSEGYNPKDISIVMKNRGEQTRIANDTGADVAGGALSGAATGATIGGIAGFLAATVLPGLGAFFIGGPIAGALGLTGTVAATVTGATTGAVAGGLLGGLMNLGLSRDDAQVYEEHVKSGAVLLAVPVRTGEDQRVEDILHQFDANNVKAIDNDDKNYRSDSPSQMSARHEDLGYAYASKGGRATRKKNQEQDLDDDLNERTEMKDYDEE